MASDAVFLGVLEEYVKRRTYGECESLEGLVENYIGDDAWQTYNVEGIVRDLRVDINGRLADYGIVMTPEDEFESDGRIGRRDANVVITGVLALIDLETIMSRHKDDDAPDDELDLDERPSGTVKRFVREFIIMATVVAVAALAVAVWFHVR